MHRHFSPSWAHHPARGGTACPEASYLLGPMFQRVPLHDHSVHVGLHQWAHSQELQGCSQQQADSLHLAQPGV